MAKQFIVAVELGSSKMTGIAGTKNVDGSITILAVEQENASSCIRRGVVYNTDKTILALSNIIKRLKMALKTEITQVYVGVGGQSILGKQNVIVREFETEEKVTQDMVNQLMDSNRSMEYYDQEILDAITQEYKVDHQNLLDPVGIQCTRLEGHFLNILWRHSFYQKLNQCLENVIGIADLYIAPLVLAESVLTEAERRSGCVLVDLGAETTTVSVYHKNILRHLSVIPLGCRNITKDIMSLQMEEEEAEAMKRKYGSAFTSVEAIDEKLELPIDAERRVKNTKFIEIIEGRVNEIIQNVRFQVESQKYDIDKLLGGIVLTGGGSNMKNIEVAFRQNINVEKIRIARFVTQTITSSNTDMIPHNGELNTVLGLLAKGNENCAGKPLSDDLFANEETPPIVEGIHKVRNIEETAGTGIVLTAAEKQRQKDEAERKREEAENEKQKKDEKKKSGVFGKLISGIKSFGQTLIQGENESEEEQS